MTRIKAFYDHGMWELRDEIGWVVEKTGESCVLRPDVGEINSTGDLVETALILGRWGWPAYFEQSTNQLLFSRAFKRFIGSAPGSIRRPGQPLHQRIP